MSSRRLDRLSDLFFAVGDAILAQGWGLKVGNYNDFNFEQEVGDGTILIELEGSRQVVRSAEGRKGHRVRVTLHAVVGRWRENANLEAGNLAAELQNLADDNRWGLPGRQCLPPEEITTGPSMYSEGKGGYEAWAASFWQTIYLGPSLLEEDPVITGMPLFARTWEVSNIDDPTQYTPLEP